MTQAQMTQVANDVIDRAIRATTTQSLVDHACFSLLVSVESLELAAQERVTCAERDALKVTAWEMGLRLDRLYQRLTEGKQ